MALQWLRLTSMVGQAAAWPDLDGLDHLASLELQLQVLQAQASTGVVNSK